ncbi:MAG TPA: class I SAM-dependent methyltransferase [Acidimicrobiales bacterium]|nr:class I SAM-dependent methyltransferase [Acidimicrobiales bacterium]
MMWLDRPLARRLTSGLLWGLAAAHVFEAVQLRKRRQQIPPLPAVDPGLNPSGKLELIAARGVEVDEATLAAAGQEMEVGGAQVVDLVPGDLPVDRALRLLRRVNPEQLGTDPFYTPGGAHEVVAVHPSVAERMSPDDARIEAASNTSGTDPLDRDALVRRTVKAQRYAPTATAVRVAPGLRTGPWSPADRWQELEASTGYAWPYGSLPPILVGIETAHLVAMTAGLLVAPVGAVAALATWCAQPALVFADEGSASKDEEALGQQPGSGGPGLLTPTGTVRASLLRLPEVWASNLRTVLAGVNATRAKAARRAAQPTPRPPDVHTLFEPRRDACAWCGSDALVPRLDVTDLLQHKPGVFHLDECKDCGHIFQNPALTIEGLDYYYEDAYEGIGEELAETSFAALVPIYERRVDAVARVTEPRRWLDVGTGHAHFCLAARRRWPDATFDGIDMSETVDEAQRRGRIDTAYRGTFPEMADELPRTYDVVSMHHYIEHTREPHRELEAAAKVLQPGGYLMIEMPDPATPWSRRLGRYWWQWGQPQHQHFVPCEEMEAALQSGGFEILSVQRGEATMGGELFNTVGLMLQHTVRSPHLPWLPPTSVAHRAKRLALYTAAVPFMAVTKVADELKDAVLRRADRPGNAYRIVARRT